MWGINFGPDGALYIADHDNGRVRRLGTDGIISTVAGGGTAPSGYGGDGGAATLATLYSPQGVALSPDGNLYVADSSNWRIRLVNIGPPIRAGDALVGGPGMDSKNDAAWVYLTGQRRVRKLPNPCCDTPTPATAGNMMFDEVEVFTGDWPD